MSYVLFDILIVFLFLMLYSFRNTVHIINDRCHFLFRNHCDQTRILPPPPPTFMFMFKLDPTIQQTIIPLSLFGRIKVQKGRVWKF